MIPLRDSKPARVFPLVTVGIIVLNGWVFLQEQFLLARGESLQAFFENWALVPAFIDWSRLETLHSLVTSQFLHASLIHILPNMWFLWIFGDNVEERFGKFFFPAVYLFSGFVGNLAQYLISPTSPIPILGASGAVAGVLGAYFVLFPRHTIKTLVPYFGFADIPAGLMLFYWFFTQLFSGVGSLAVASIGGVAWFAHIGGFVTGWIIAKLTKQLNHRTIEP